VLSSVIFLYCNRFVVTMFIVKRKLKNASPLQASGAAESRPYHRPSPVE
jgi:hypothetical protein